MTPSMFTTYDHNLFTLFRATCNKFDKKDVIDLKDTILIHDSLAFTV